MRTRVAAALVGAALAATAVSCSSNHRTVTRPPVTRATSATSATSEPTTTVAPCAPDRTYPAGTTHHYMRVDGVRRELLVHMPAASEHRMMLIVDFHGATSNMQQQSVYSGFDPIADRDDFVVATPNATGPPAGRQWKFLGNADLDFAVAIVHELVARACVDARRTFATGISSGAAMTAALACRASATFAGFAPVAADFYNAAFCGAAVARPLLIFHGTADRVVPYAGGDVHVLGSVPVRPAEESAARWARHNGCGSTRTGARLSSEVVRYSWPRCNAPVVMYKIVGGGHTWPGTSISVPALGHATAQISASELIVKTFAAL